MSSPCIRTNCDSRNYGHKLWRVGRHWMQEHAGRLPSAIRDFISLSQLSEDVLAPHLGKGSHIHRVPNFIDVQQGAMADVEAATTFTFVGRLSPEKGPTLLARCAERLNIEVAFVGDDPEKEDLAMLAPRALFTGWLSSEQVREHAKVKSSGVSSL